MIQENNALQFKKEFSKIEQFISARSKSQSNSFAIQLQELVNRRDSLVTPYESRLIEFAKLRNLIEHSSIDIEKTPYAIPHDSTLIYIKDLYTRLSNPQTANEVATKNITTITKDHSIADALNLMKSGGFTILPVLNSKNEVEYVFSEYSLVKWLSSNMTSDGLILENTIISEIEEYLDKPDASDSNSAYLFTDRKKLAADVFKNIEDSFKNDIRLNATFVTETGSKNEKVIGLITPWDVSRIKF